MQFVVAIVGLIVVLGGLAAVKVAQIGKLIDNGKTAEAAGPPPEAVATAVAARESWEELIPAIGSVATEKGVTIAAEVPGVVQRIAFESGATVKKDQVLVELESSVERAELASARARRGLAETEAKRSRKLAESGAISKAELESTEAGLATAARDTEALAARIAKKTIRAPFAGKLGIRAVNLGQYLAPGAPITVIETDAALHVDFSVPQQRLGEIAVGMPARITLASDAPGAPEGGTPAAIRATIAAIDPTVDPATRNLRVRANVEGDVDRLRPGMFVDVAVVLPKRAEVVSVPATAILHAPYGDSVFVVEPKPNGEGRVARQKFVKVGSSQGDFVAVERGLDAKEEVVVAGAFKLKNDSPVIVDNTKRPPASLAPKPENR